jgi:hypothetical protein
LKVSLLSRLNLKSNMILKLLKRMRLLRELTKQERRWTRQIDLLTHYRIIRKDGFKMLMSSRH